MDKKRGWKGARYQDKAGSQEASKVFNVKVETEYLNPDYDLELLQDNRITEQGLLLCAKLKPKKPSLPEFWFRWDEKDGHLNVDMRPDEGYRDDWQNEKHGYKGHKPQKASDRPGRAFKLLITTPSSEIFDGVVVFNLARDAVATATLRMHTSVEVATSKPLSK